MNWDDPAERLALIERVGADEYNRLFKEHRRSSVVATVNGYGISWKARRTGLFWWNPHWRGREEFGVVTHDYEVTT